MKVELRSSTAIGGVPCVVTTGGLRKLSWFAGNWATTLQLIFIGGWTPMKFQGSFSALAGYAMNGCTKQG